MIAYGIDVGGSGVKGAPVDLETGELDGERVRIKTPQPATPGAILETCLEVVRQSEWNGPVGCGFPAVIKGGIIQTATNIDDSNIGFDLAGGLESELGNPVHVLNDADAAGVAEMHWGAGRDESGVVLMLTLGTGIGTALFVNGSLVPNTELSHIEIDGHDAETRAADSARKRENLKWKEYAARLDRYVTTIENLLWPDLVIIGGGISKKSDRFIPRLSARTKVVSAQMLNEAGIAGAALASVTEQTPVSERSSR